MTYEEYFNAMFDTFKIDFEASTDGRVTVSATTADDDRYMSAALNQFVADGRIVGVFPGIYEATGPFWQEIQAI